MPLPRVITVDPTWSLSRVLHAVLDVTERSVLQVDVPDSAAALQELTAGCNLMLLSFQVDENTKGFELASRVRMKSPDTAVIVLGDVDDPEEFDEMTAGESPFVYLRRPVDPQRFLRVVQVGLEGGDVKAAAYGQSDAKPLAIDMGPVPHIDVRASTGVIDKLLIDVGAMAIILGTRAGEVLVERGAVGYLNREKLSAVLANAMLSSIDMKDFVGGQLSAVLFFDGADYDIFVMSVGLHHFLTVVFDGESGTRQFGGVMRYGRKAAEELIAKLGANAFIVQKATPTPPPATEQRRARPTASKSAALSDDTQPLERASLDPIAPSEAEPAPQADPIQASEDELAKLLSGDLGGAGDDLFDLDSMEQMVNENLQNQKGRLGYDEAKKIGLF